MEKLFFKLCLLHFFKILDIFEQVAREKIASKKAFQRAKKDFKLAERKLKKEVGEYCSDLCDNTAHRIAREIYHKAKERYLVAEMREYHERKQYESERTQCQNMYNLIEFSTRNFTKFSAYINDSGNIVINAA